MPPGQRGDAQALDLVNLCGAQEGDVRGDDAGRIAAELAAVGKAVDEVRREGCREGAVDVRPHPRERRVVARAGAIVVGGGGRFAEKVSHAEERGERTGGGRVDGLDALVQRRKVAADVARDQDLDRVRVGHLARELKMARCP